MAVWQYGYIPNLPDRFTVHASDTDTEQYYGYIPNLPDRFTVHTDDDDDDDTDTF
jgi:hypothetical protein